MSIDFLRPNETSVDKLCSELVDLTLKLDTLRTFLVTLGFQELERSERIELTNQHEAMTWYRQILARRVSRAGRSEHAES